MSCIFTENQEQILYDYLLKDKRTYNDVKGKIANKHEEKRYVKHITQIEGGLDVHDGKRC